MEEKKLRRITREFNRWRYPECRARTIKNEEDEIIIKFDGTFNYSCCFDEHFEDYRIMLEEEGEKYTIEEVKQIGNKFIVRYKRDKI